MGHLYRIKLWNYQRVFVWLDSSQLQDFLKPISPYHNPPVCCWLLKKTCFSSHDKNLWMHNPWPMCCWKNPVSSHDKNICGWCPHKVPEAHHPTPSRLQEANTCGRVAVHSSGNFVLVSPLGKQSRHRSVIQTTWRLWRLCLFLKGLFNVGNTLHQQKWPTTW